MGRRCFAVWKTHASISCTPTGCSHGNGVRQISSMQRPPLVSWGDYGGRFIAAVENGPLVATQFHPEKSGDAGSALLRNWVGSLA